MASGAGADQQFPDSPALPIALSLSEDEDVEDNGANNSWKMWQNAGWVGQNLSRRRVGLGRNKEDCGLGWAKFFNPCTPWAVTPSI